MCKFRHPVLIGRELVEVVVGSDRLERGQDLLVPWGCDYRLFSPRSWDHCLSGHFFLATTHKARPRDHWQYARSPHDGVSTPVYGFRGDLLMQSPVVHLRFLSTDPPPVGQPSTRQDTWRMRQYKRTRRQTTPLSQDQLAAQCRRDGSVTDVPGTPSLDRYHVPVDRQQLRDVPVGAIPCLDPCARLDPTGHPSRRIKTERDNR